MGDSSGNIDVGKLIAYSDDLVGLLKDEKGINSLTECFEQSKAFQASSAAEFAAAKNLVEDYQGKINECGQKIEKAKCEVDADVELELLQKELDAEMEKERALMEELRAINDEINDLERQRISVERQRQITKKLEQDEFRAQRTLSMYASVTTIIPNLDDQSKISGYIVDREKKVVEKFEFDPTTRTVFDTCQDIWKMISLR